MIDRFERFSMAIFEISRYWHKIAADEMEKYGLKGPHCIYLMTMRQYPGGITASALGEVCGRDKADVSRMVSIMEKKGLICKEGTHQNMYRGLLKLTPAGKEAAEQVCQRVTLAVDAAGNGMDERQRKTFYDSLELISGNLRRISQDGLPQNSSEPV